MALAVPAPVGLGADDIWLRQWPYIHSSSIDISFLFFVFNNVVRLHSLLSLARFGYMYIATCSASKEGHIAPEGPEAFALPGGRMGRNSEVRAFILTFRSTFLLQHNTST